MKYFSVFFNLIHYSPPKFSMENLYPREICLSLFLLFFHFFYLLLLSSAYTLPEQYFINCGSSSNTTVNSRTFIADVNSGSFTLTARESRLVEENNPPAGLSSIYQTARIFTKPSWYELDIVQYGIYVVRLHFYPLTSSVNLNTAQFDVLASEFSLLSNFSARNNTKLPNIQEFLLNIKVGKFRISFTPSHESSFAFISAIEAFLAPETFVPDSARHVTPAGSENSYNGLLSGVLHVIHRINVGGPTLTPDNDTLGRNWELDDDYLLVPQAAKNSNKSGVRPNYQDQGATEYDAPDLVYNTAKEMNIDISKPNNWFNITWRFNVSTNARYRARFHFCDIISKTTNDSPRFNLYIYSTFAQLVDPFDMVVQLEAPFYHDFVVDSDDSGFMSISVGPRSDSTQTAFLNGVEIMELIGNPVQDSSKKHLIVIIAPVAGGAVFIFIFVVVLIFVLKRRKQKPVETNDWPLVPLYGGNSYGGSTERTVNASPLPDFNLGLKIPVADILYATKNFDKKLMIGEGGFGKVYKGTLPNGVKVAVKRSEPGHGQGLPEFHTEINVLSRIRHRHLVSLIGYCAEGSEMILVYEFMEKGTLSDNLYKLNEESKNPVAQPKLSWHQRLEICIGAAKGLHYLHSGLDGPIIHRDVKSTNILLDEDYVAKVSDFGLSRSGPLDQTHISTDVKGSFGYLDPEYFRCLQLTQKSDVYSFGVVLLEVLCARPAINNLLPREQVNLADWGLSWQKKGQLEKIMDPLLLGKINPNSLRKFGETIEKCLEEYGVDRPNMVDVLWNLEYALRLQLSTIPTQPSEDSKTDVSVELPLHVLNRLPSHSIPISENEMSLSSENMDSSYTDASRVFSQLKMDEAR